MDLVNKVENQRFDNFDNNDAISFVDIINALGSHFNHTTADNNSTSIQRDSRTGQTKLGIATEATAKEVLQMLKQEANTDISDFGRRLKDVGILLAREDIVQKSNIALEFANQVYRLGCSIRNEDVREISDLSKQNLSNESQTYKNELFLWAIGRDDPDSKYARNLHGWKRVHPIEKPYVGDKITKEQRELKARRSEATLKHKSLLLKYFVENIESRNGELSKETKVGLEKTFLSAAKQATINILTKNAWQNWEKNLRVPPAERKQYLDNDIRQIFEIIPGFKDESLRIVEAVNELKNSERWHNLSDIEKVRDI
ncbi:hypothetical protein IPJ91_01525 [bacterium]|nr:MAG: hypothetical protein IPJ91_01525 [bacterium]